MIVILLRMVSLSAAMFFLGLAVSISQGVEFIIDFSTLTPEELLFFEWSFFILFAVFFLLTVVVRE